MVIKNSEIVFKNSIGIFGAGGFGREIMPLVMEQNSMSGTECKIFFVDANPPSPEIDGVECVTPDTFYATQFESKSFVVSVAAQKHRSQIVSKLLTKGYKPLEVRSRSARIYQENEIGVGAIFCDFTIVTNNAKIGDFFHCNINSYVAHDCVIGDFVTFAPGVMCNGNVHIGDGAYIGTGAVIKQGTSAKPLIIGPGATVGMGAVVTKDVPANATVIGNPARII
jgi:sugar O-acyltransferase (sialic acid O-acetyltransferase NeuD family)